MTVTAVVEATVLVPLAVQVAPLSTSKALNPVKALPRPVIDPALVPLASSRVLLAPPPLATPISTAPGWRISRSVPPPANFTEYVQLPPTRNLAGIVDRGITAAHQHAVVVPADTAPCIIHDAAAGGKAIP